MIRLDKYRAATRHLQTILGGIVLAYIFLSIPWPRISIEQYTGGGHGTLFSCVVLVSVVLRVRCGGRNGWSCSDNSGAFIRSVKQKDDKSTSATASSACDRQKCSNSLSRKASENNEPSPPATSTKPTTRSQPFIISLPSKNSVDVLSNPSVLPDNIFNAICTYINPRDVTTGLAPASKSTRSRADSNAIWSEYWYRDYGDTLLQWDVAREVLSATIALNEGSRLHLKRALSQKLGDLKSTKEFYFVFGECWMNFILAGHNNPRSKCLVGLHGHVFDFGAFAPYHPGLVDRILSDCGQDATEAFETIRHSRPARVLATMTCLIVSKRWGDGSQCLKHSKQINSGERDAVFRRSNTRPPRSGRDEAKRLLPNVPRSGRPATLARIREQLDREKSKEEGSLPSSDWRLYHNPFQQNWIRWNSAIVHDLIGISPREITK